MRVWRPSGTAPRHPAWWVVAALLAVGVPGLVVALSGPTTQLGSEITPTARPTPVLPERPNIVIIQTDDQTVEQLAAMPRVRALLGDQGTSYDRYLASFPLCCPSRATLLTGQYSHNTGVRGNSEPYGGYAHLKQDETLPVWLTRAGYTTGHVGKFLNGYGKADPHEVPLGWTDWVSPPYPHQHSYTDYELNVNGKLVAYGASAADHVDDVYTGLAVDFLERNSGADEPFFLALDYLAPHRGAPYRTGERCDAYAKPAPRHEGDFATAVLPRPPSFNEPDLSDKPPRLQARKPMSHKTVVSVTENYQCRREALLAVDDGVQTIMDTLERLGRMDDTYVLFVSDNAFFQGEHRIPLGKQRVYEANVRVPFLVRGPGIAPGAKLATLAANVDVAPTVLELTGARDQVAAAFLLDGHSLVPELTGAEVNNPAAGPDRAVLLENGPGIPGAPEFYAVRTDRYVYAEYLDGSRELYDLQLDPDELDSRHDDPDYAVVRATLAPVLAVLRACAGPTCEVAVSVPTPTPVTPIAHAAPRDRS